MSKYTITIEGDFKKGECYYCPIARSAKRTVLMSMDCPLRDKNNNCPLEEVDVTDINVGNKVKQGEWMYINPLQIDDGGAYICSNCKTGNWNYSKDFNFCPNCGADMRTQHAD